MLLDAFEWKHHTAVRTRIPHDNTFDGECRLHLLHIKSLHTEDANIFYEIRVNKFTSAKYLHGFRKRTSQFNLVSLTDSGQPDDGKICREDIGCWAEGQNEWSEVTLKRCFQKNEDPHLGPESEFL